MDAQWAAQLVRAGNASVPCPPWPSRPPLPPAPIFVRRLTDHSPSALSTGSHEPDRAVRDRRGSVDKSSPGAPAPSGPRCPGLVPAPPCPPGCCCACVPGSGHARALVLTATLAEAEGCEREEREKRLTQECRAGHANVGWDGRGSVRYAARAAAAASHAACGRCGCCGRHDGQSAGQRRRHGAGVFARLGASVVCIGLEALLPHSTRWGCFLDFAQLALAARGF